MSFVSPALMFVVFAFGLLCALVCALGIYVVGNRLRRRIPVFDKQFGLGTFITLLLSGACVYITWKPLWLEFNRMMLTNDRVELHYWWPRGTVVLKRADVKRFYLIGDRRGRRGHVEVITDVRVYRGAGVTGRDMQQVREFLRTNAVRVE